MKLIFIGEDDSMGFRRGKKYDCEIGVHAGSKYIWLATFADGKLLRCPYSSFKNLLENWLEI